MRAYLRIDGKDVVAPLFAPDSTALPVAKVDDEAITLGQLMDSLAMAHMGRKEGAAVQHDFRPALDRLIDVKVVAIEAREMALDELPEVNKAIAAEEQSELIGGVRAIAMKGVKADPAEADRMYRVAVREWKLRSLLFDKEVDAKAFQKAVRKGGDFEALGKKAIASKKAKGTTDAGYAAPSSMLPQVATAIAKAKQGAVGIVKVPEGWSIFQVAGARYPDSPEAKSRAEVRALQAAQARAVERCYVGLEKKYANIDWKLVDRLDFEAPKPGFAALKKDKRVLARITGEEPFTVADLAQGLEMKFFHGVESPVKEHRVNAEKHVVFKTLLRRRLVMKDAARLGLASSQSHQRHMAEFREATLFTAYVERAIMPQVKVTEEEGKVYYEKHKAEFTSPAMYRLESLVFTTPAAAQSALDRLRQGTDFKWLRTNAEGQVKEDARAANLDGTTVSSTALTPGLRAQLAGAKNGDYRLEQIEGQYFLVRVVATTDARTQSYQEARETIGKKLIGENLSKTLQASAEKLRKARTVTVYLTKLGF
jgi:hypothetical protein